MYLKLWFKYGLLGYLVSCHWKSPAKNDHKSHAALIADLNNLGKDDNTKGKDFVHVIFNKITGKNDGFRPNP